jgi:hypothetical protein
MTDDRATIEAELRALGERPPTDDELGDLSHDQAVANVQDLIEVARPLPPDLAMDLDTLAHARVRRRIEAAGAGPSGAAIRRAWPAAAVVAAAAAIGLWLTVGGERQDRAEIEQLGGHAHAILSVLDASAPSPTERATAIERRHRERSMGPAEVAG